MIKQNVLNLHSLPKWTRRHVELANFVATWSKDPSTKVGAVLVGTNRRQIAFGYNGFPEGVQDTPERLNDRPTKYRLIAHAERNCLDQAAFDAKGGTLVVTKHPCAECAKSIVSKGIVKVVCPPVPADDRWVEEVRWAQVILEEAGVIITLADFGDPPSDGLKLTGVQPFLPGGLWVAGYNEALHLAAERLRGKDLPDLADRILALQRTIDNRSRVTVYGLQAEQIHEFVRWFCANANMDPEALTPNQIRKVLDERFRVKERDQRETT